MIWLPVHIDSRLIDILDNANSYRIFERNTCMILQGRRRACWHVALLLLSVTVLVGAALALHAATSPLSPSAARSIDWQHPVRVPGPGMALSGVGSATTGDVLTPLPGTNALVTVPQANFPSACWHGVAYRVGVHGVYSWSSSNRGMTAWVEYVWCQRWAGDAIGLNFAYGRALVQNQPAPSCTWVAVGGGPGAWIESSPAKIVTDGEDWNDYNICPGQYAWDYSQTVPGNGLYAVAMSAYDDDIHTNAAVMSPCCY